MIYYNLISLLIAIVIIKKFNFSFIRVIALIVLPIFLYSIYFSVKYSIIPFNITFQFPYILERSWDIILRLMPALIIFTLLTEYLYKVFFQQKTLFIFLLSVGFLLTFDIGSYHFNGNMLLRIFHTFVPLLSIGIISGLMIYVLPSIYKNKK